MTCMDTKQPIETLDPENWEEMRELAHRMVDDMLNYASPAQPQRRKLDLQRFVQELLDSIDPFFPVH